MRTDAIKAAMDAATKAGIGLTAMKTQNKSPIATETEADLKLGGHFIQRGFTQQQANQGRLGKSADRLPMLANAQPDHPSVEHRGGPGQNQPHGSGPRGAT